MLNVTCAVIIYDGKILVTQRGKNSDHPFKWEFPGGKIQINESPEDCIKREIREELNIEIDVLKLMKPVDFDYGFKQINLIPFMCSYKAGEFLLREHHAFKWIDLEELEETDLSEADLEMVKLKSNRIILKEYLRKYVDKT
ncbi:MAG: (deoxy)nucleoside triphosphate pyrophosphohydrolase [Draconibacterium sp.]|jgi:8-oxo-dGTP diphosphatase